VALLGILGLVGANHFWRWHERWISYRLLAELCRKQHVLCLFGWSLPRWEVERITDDDDATEDVPATSRYAWVAWYFTAVTRSAPLPSGTFTREMLDCSRETGRGLFTEQAEYHKERQTRSGSLSVHLGNLAEFFFFSVILLIILKLVPSFDAWHNAGVGIGALGFRPQQPLVSGSGPMPSSNCSHTSQRACSGL
jgi:hypothetical protein